MFLGPLSVVPALVIAVLYVGCAALFAARALIAMRQGLAARVAALSAVSTVLAVAAIYHVALALGISTYLEAWQSLNLLFAVVLFWYSAGDLSAEIRAFRFINGNKQRHDDYD